MRSIERARLGQIKQVGLENAAKGLTGHDHRALQVHLKIAGALLRGDQSHLGSSKVRQWLYKQAEGAGYTREHVDRVIRDVRSAPSPEAAAHRYAKAIASEDSAAAQGVEMARQYTVHETSFSVGDRLAERDQQQAKGGTQYVFKDEPRYKDSREQNMDMRRQIESAIAAKTGVLPDRELSLEQRQARAQAFSNAVADRLESNKETDISLRQAIEDNYDAETALAAKRDVGLSNDSVGSILERTYEAKAAANLYQSDIGG